MADQAAEKEAKDKAAADPKYQLCQTFAEGFVAKIR